MITWIKLCSTETIFKKGNKSDPANYRPLSQTCICCKIMEHMSKHLSLNNILIDEQHGFRKKFCCETQLISAVHDWAKGINLRRQTDVILLDFSKAFDLPNLIFMKLEVKCLVGLKLFCPTAQRMFQSMEFSPHGDLWYLESPRVLSWDRCCSFCLSMIFHALFNQIYVYLRMTVYYTER